jgi:acyl-CoA synthetase (AMP-forming)/AMP-acid ligase II
VRPGDRIGLYAANSLEWVIAFWATVSAGAVVSAMNSYWSDPETTAALDLTQPRLVLADPRRHEILARVGSDAPVLVLDEDLYARVTTGPVPDLVPAATDEDDPVLFMFTSGTSGRPKAVVHRHRTVIGLYQCAIYNALLRMGDLPNEIPPPPRVLVGPPFFHLSALFGSIVMYTASSGLLVLRPGRFDEERVLRAIQEEEVTYWLSVGSSAPRVAAHPRLAEFDLSSIEMVMVGGAPVTPAVRRLLRRAFPGGVDNIRMGYTSTECGTNIATIGGDEFEQDPESAGPIQDGLQVEIRDSAGKPVPEGTDGNVFVRSPYVMLGYLDNPEDTAAVLDEDGWLSMGDVGRLEGGQLYLNSRARDLIFVSSENVYPSEVENRLEEHPDVVESCVAGIEDTFTGQAVKAFVVLAEGSPVTIDELSEHCRAGLPPYKVPTSWDLRCDPLPRNATGKILRSQLVADTEGVTA